MRSHEGDVGGVGGTYVALDTSHRDGTWDAPTEGDLYGNGVPLVVVRVTAHQGGREGHSQGKGVQVVGIQSSCGTRDAESQSGIECHLLLRSDKRDCWRARVIRKRSRFVRLGATGEGHCKRNLVSCLLNLKHMSIKNGLTSSVILRGDPYSMVRKIMGYWVYNFIFRIQL
jgi:hypothetical protein